jgi:hypothetical protein
VLPAELVGAAELEPGAVRRAGRVCRRLAGLERGCDFAGGNFVVAGDAGRLVGIVQKGRQPVAGWLSVDCASAPMVLVASAIPIATTMLPCFLMENDPCSSRGHSVFEPPGSVQS